MTTNEAAPESPMVMAMIALRDKCLPDQGSFAAAVKSICEEKEIKCWDESDSAATFEFSDGICGLGVIPFAIPWTELEGPCSTAWWWPDATQQLRKHKAHLVVSFRTSMDDPIGARLELTSLISAAAKCTDAIGVYWGEGTVVWPTSDWIAMCQRMSREFLPLDLWIDFRVRREDDQTCCGFTTGLKSLGHTEIEVHGSISDPKSIRSNMWNAAHHLLDHGPVLKDGDTIGFERDQRIQISHVPSMLEQTRTVIRLVC
jgi:hypothetical protein